MVSRDYSLQNSNLFSRKSHVITVRRIFFPNRFILKQVIWSSRQSRKQWRGSLGVKVKAVLD